MLIATTLQAVSSAHVGMDMREMAGFAEVQSVVKAAYLCNTEHSGDMFAVHL
jgi:hypothetical protein